jgi:hypothetical protein
MPDGWQEFVKKPHELFFPEGKGTVTPAWKATIESVCESCPVRAACLMHGVKHETEGWWGGCSPLAIAKMRQEQNIPLVTPEIDPHTRKVIGTFHQPGHGTMERYRQHRYDGEEPCPACREARSDYFADYRKKAYKKWKDSATPEELAAKREENRERNSHYHKSTGWHRPARAIGGEADGRPLPDQGGEGDAP